MRLVDYHHIPWRVCNIGGFVARELIRTNDDAVRLERAEVTDLNRGVIRLRFKNSARQEKLLGYFLMPLFSQVRRNNNENAALPLRPFLRKDQSCLDRFSQPNFICKESAFRERRTESKKR